MFFFINHAEFFDKFCLYTCTYASSRDKNVDNRNL